MNYIIPKISNQAQKSALTPYFERVRGDIKPGAERLQFLVFPWLEQGILDLPTILVTGSNGKGSTCAFLESLFRYHGFKTGLYTSPHLVHPNERVRINGIPIQENLLQKNVNIIADNVPFYLPDASFFEITTAAALLCFVQEKIDILICEVGLGGHFDSTNALSPMASILTSVALEHTDMLGYTLEQIAFDKSHISRRNRPFFISDSLPQEAVFGVERAANKIGCIITKVKDIENPKIPSSFFAQQNSSNLSLALSCFKNIIHRPIFLQKENEELINKAIASTFWPGRFDVRTINNRTVVFDAAHNPHGFSYFIKQYKSSQFGTQKCVLLFSSLSDKDWRESLKDIRFICDVLIVTQTPSQRAELLENFSDFLTSEETFKKIHIAIEPSIEQAIVMAMNIEQKLPLVITGSIAFLGAIMQKMGVEVFPT